MLLAACEDDGVRQTMKVDDVDWAYLSDGVNDIKIETIRVGDYEIDDITKYEPFLKLMNEHQEEIQQTAGDNLVQIYIRFLKYGRFNEVYTVDEYEGMETYFYIDKTIVKQYLQ